jgi:NTE family protein
MSQKKIGLALGGGAARGWAHVGVIEALYDCGVKVDLVAGTSIGALVGSILASGNLGSFKKAILEIDRKKIISMLDVVFPRCGLLDGKKVMDFFKSFISGREFSELEITFGAVATELQTSDEVWLTEGEVSGAVRASIAVPGLFTPVTIEDRLMVDGGLVNPLPVSLARSMGADIVIAVDLNHYLAMRGNNLKKKMQCVQDQDDFDFREKSSFHENPGTEQREGFFPGIMNRIDKMDFSMIESIKNFMNKPASPNIFDIIFASTLVMEKTITGLRLEKEPADVLIRPEVGEIRFMDFHRAAESIQEGYDSCISSITSSKKAMNLFGISKSRAAELKSNISLQD